MKKSTRNFMFLLIFVSLVTFSIFSTRAAPYSVGLQRIFSKTLGVSSNVSPWTNKNSSQDAHLSPEVETENTNYKDVLLLPDDTTLNIMSEIQQLELFLKYVNTIQAHCRNFIRVGVQTDGGKEICIDKAYRPKAPCLVYSFGIGYKWDFDNMVVELFGCEVHCFDPTIRMETGRVSDKIWFYNEGLGDKDGPNNRNWSIKTLSTFRKELKHEDRVIDILKIDIEGSEWKAIIQMIESGALSYVKQMAVELHFPSRAKNKPDGWRSGDTGIHLSCLRQLYNAGFRIVMKDRNIFAGNVGKWPQFKHPFTNLYEVTILNMKYTNT